MYQLSFWKYPSGSKVYDWTIPDEWSVKEAWLKDASSNILLDFKENNVHLVGFSKPVRKKMLFEKKNKLHLHESLDEAIPYRTSYYKRDWGFCLTKKQFEKISRQEGLIEVCTDSKFNPKGSLTIGEILIPSSRKEEILISSYNCHPSLANDNLSGTIMTAMLARELLRRNNLKYSYRIIWVPETIGAITYCAFNEEKISNIITGMVITTVGGKGMLSYEQSRDQEHFINKYTEKTLRDLGEKYKTYPFDIHGSD